MSDDLRRTREPEKKEPAPKVDRAEPLTDDQLDDAAGGLRPPPTRPIIIIGG